jgi:carbon monoxide dehydrogenase subunit G
VDTNETFGFNAPAEVVFNSLVDPDRTDRWLPAGVSVVDRSDGKVRLSAGTGTVDVEVSTSGADMRLTFQVVGPPRLRGSAQVTQAPAGGSQVDVAITADDSGPDRETVRRLVDETMRRLERDVEDNFTAG